MGTEAVTCPVIRVLVADLPELQGDVVAALVAAEPDMLVVGRGLPAPLERVDELAPDVILVSLGRLARALADDDGSTLADLGPPGVEVLGIAATDGTIIRVSVVPDEQDWPDKVVHAIRSAVPNPTARRARDSQVRGPLDR